MLKNKIITALVKSRNMAELKIMEPVLRGWKLSTFAFLNMINEGQLWWTNDYGWAGII